MLSAAANNRGSRDNGARSAVLPSQDLPALTHSLTEAGLPNRIIREAILTSDRYNSLAHDAERLLYLELLLLADDFGLVPINHAFIRRRTSPAAGKTVEQITTMISALADQDLIRCYTAGHSTNASLQKAAAFAYIPRFRNAPRALKPKWPAPPDIPAFNEFKELSEKRVAFANQLQADAKQLLANAPALPLYRVPNTEDLTQREDRETSQKNARARKPRAVVSEPPGFARFWQRWPSHPRKANRAACLTRWQTAGCEAQADAIIAKVDAWRVSLDWTKDGGQFIPAPLVWLNQERYGAEAPAPAGKATHDGKYESMPWLSKNAL